MKFRDLIEKDKWQFAYIRSKCYLTMKRCSSYKGWSERIRKDEPIEPGFIAQQQRFCGRESTLAQPVWRAKGHQELPALCADLDPIPV